MLAASTGASHERYPDEEVAAMNSLDPWRVIAIDAYNSEVIWPRARYQHPFYSEVPSWISYGGEEEDGSTRLLFDGAFVGANYPGADMSGGITFKKELDDRQVLHVEICVDGKCHRASMNLAPAIAMVMAKLAESHADLHRSMGGACPPPDAAAAVDRAVSTAGDTLIGMLAYRHAVGRGGGGHNPYTGTTHMASDYAVGFDLFKDIGHALSSAANAVGGVLKDLKAPLSIAAGAAATYVGGPAAGPIAAQLTGALIDAAPGGHPATQAAAQQQIAAAKQAAQTNPTVQTALDAAHHATTQGTQAALGTTPAVQATPNTLAAAVQKFLPVATQAATGAGGAGISLPPELQSALSTFSGLVGGGAPAVSSGWYDVVGSTVDDLRERARSFASTKPGNAVGVVQMADGRFQARGFRSLDDSIDWLSRLTGRRGDFTYAAVYERASDGTAWIRDEEFGSAVAPAVSGAAYAHQAYAAG
jgi:hypothetical protein